MSTALSVTNNKQHKVGNECTVIGYRNAEGTLTSAVSQQRCAVGGWSRPTAETTFLVVSQRQSCHSSGRRVQRFVRNILPLTPRGKRNLRRSTEASGIAEPERGRHRVVWVGIQEWSVTYPTLPIHVQRAPLARSVAPTDQVISPNRP